MSSLYFTNICDDEVGEVEGVLDDDGNVISWWSLNDANWRNEYFSSFMKSLGFDTYYTHSDFMVSQLRQKVIEDTQ